MVYTRDWHPADHVSFTEKPQYVDGSWPAHCVAGTEGAALRRDLVLLPQGLIVDKGTDPGIEAYSSFQGTDLAEKLRARGVASVYITGLATDYCVKATALDAVREGFRTFVVVDACRGVDVPSGSVLAALDELNRAGVQLITSEEAKNHEE